MSATNAKQTAVNQAAQIAMNRGHFQPFYYYTANNTNGQTVQLHSYPGMIGMPNPQLYAHPQFAYNFYAHAQAQALQQQSQNGHQNGQGLLNTPTNQKQVQFHQNSKKNAQKNKISNQNSESDGSDHGLGLNSKTESASENGTHNSCDMDKSTINGTNTQKSGKNKKNKKPSKKVIVIDLPEDLQSIETVTNKCQQYGEILLVRVLKPGKVLPFDLKMYSGKIHDLGTTCCAIIEFESPIAASATVEAEENNLKCALLQNGADIALYGHNHNNKANSELGSHGESEHTHGESGIGGRSAGTRSESTHSDELDNSVSHTDDSSHFESKVSKIQINKEITLEKNSTKNNVFRPSFLKNKVQNQTTISTPSKGLGLLETPPKEFEINQDDLESLMSDSLEQEYIAEYFEPQQKIINNESKIINTNNGRVTTALNITLNVSKPSLINRNAIKMDLTQNTQNTKMINFNASEILPTVPSKIGRTSPALLSDPSDDMLLAARFSQDSSDEFEFKKYSRSTLFNLRDCKRASELPIGLPNIPELLPVARRF